MTEPGPDRLTLPAFLEDVVAQGGSHAAVVGERGALTYTELGAHAHRLASDLVAWGVAPGDRVALLLANRPEWAVAFFAAALAGAVPVPISTFATPEERAWVLAHADVRWLLMQRRLAARDFAAELDAAPAPGLAGIACLDEARGAFAEIRRPADTPDAVRVVGARASAALPESDGLLIYTSGTTERPKGVLHRQRAPVLQSWRFAALMGLDANDRVFTAQPFFWTAGIAMSLGATLAAGATLWVRETFEPDDALATIARERITTVHAWPHQEKAMAEHASAGEHDLTCVTHVEFGSPLAKLAGLEEDRWGIHASYGLSETFTLVTALAADAPAEARRACHGVPLPGNEVRILDPETGGPCPPGTSGEIAVRGPTLMRGYWKVPDANVFDDEGFFRTGDSGTLDDAGQLHWAGRLSGIVKTGGANVSPLEVEGAAAREPGVAASVAVGVPHPTLGEALVLCVVPVEGAQIDLQALAGRLATALSAYKRPRHVMVLDAADVPRTGTQKLRADAVRDLARERLESGSVVIAGHVYGT